MWAPANLLLLLEFLTHWPEISHWNLIISFVFIRLRHYRSTTYYCLPLLLTTILTYCGFIKLDVVHGPYLLSDIRVKSWRWVTLFLVLWEKKMYFHKLFNFRHIKVFFYLEFHFIVKTKLVKNCVSFLLIILWNFFIDIWYVNLVIVWQYVP